jgi:hypothetical protein
MKQSLAYDSQPHRSFTFNAVFEKGQQALSHCRAVQCGDRETGHGNRA